MTSSAVLGAKLSPPTARAEYLRRPRLHERLARCLDARVTAVVAGPGYGKSTVVSEFLRELDADSVWYSLDGSDGDPWLLFQYLIHGIRKRVPEFGERSAGLWESLRYREEHVERFVDVFIRDAEESLGARVVLALDRVETLGESSASLAAIKRLLAYLPGTLHVILIGRTLPRLGLVGPTADGSVHVIHPEELLFTHEETQSLLADCFGLALSQGTVSRVYERTRGWVMALQLLRQATRLVEGTKIPEDILQRTESDIFEYFAEEVLAKESSETRETLLSLAVPSAVDPEIAVDALEGVDVRSALDRAKERRLFISRLDGPRELYAFDPLFRDFLLEKLRASSGAAGLSRVHRAFGLAYERHGEHVQALSHLQLAGAEDELASLLMAHGRSLLRVGLLDAVRDAATSLVTRGSDAAFIDDLLGEACRLRGDFAAAVGHFQSALVVPEGDDGGLAGLRRAEALQGLAYSLMRMGEAEPAEATAERALQAAGDGDPGLVARILNTLSIVRYRRERIDEAISGWQDALARARQGSDEHLTRMIAHNLGLPHAARGDFRRATECFRILTAPENPRAGPAEGTAYLNLARIAILRGEYESAARLLDDAWEIHRKWNLRALAGDVLEAQGTLLRETGDLAAAEEKYAAARAVWIELGQLDLLDSLGEEEAIVASRRGEADRAERMAAEILGRARTTGRPDSTASALLALGEIRARSAAPASAVAPLEESARTFASLGRAYQECAAWLWLGLAATRAGTQEAARKAVEDAVRISARFDYQALVVRVASLDAAYRRIVCENPSAPAVLRSPTVTTGRRVSSLGTLTPSGADLMVRILGPVEVYRDVEAKIPASAWRLKRALKVFCYLAAARNHRATKDRIAEALWGDVSNAVIERNFHPTISFLRRALNHDHAVPKNFIVYEGGVYSFNSDYRYDVDLERFDRSIGLARNETSKGNLEGALKEYETAIMLYRGPFLEDEDDDWTAAPRVHYELLLDAALRENADLHLRAGKSRRAAELLERLVERNPSDQTESVRLMRVLGTLGQRAAVEREYRRLQRAIDASRAGGLRLDTVRAYREILAREGP